MLSTPVASAQHAQHAQLHRVRSTCSSGNRRRRWHRWHRWHPVWMALATTKLLRCAGKKRQWVAPTISANLGGVDQSMFFPCPHGEILGKSDCLGFLGPKSHAPVCIPSSFPRLERRLSNLRSTRIDHVLNSHPICQYWP